MKICQSYLVKIKKKKILVIRGNKEHKKFIKLSLFLSKKNFKKKIGANILE